MGAGGFHGRVRDGIGWFTARHGHQVVRGSVGPVSGGIGSGPGVTGVCVWLTAMHDVLDAVSLSGD